MNRSSSEKAKPEKNAEEFRRRVWLQEAQSLGKVGELLADVNSPSVTIRLPRDLAEQAMTAWRRDDDEELSDKPETFEQRVYRHRAGTFALIGLCITEWGRWEQDEVVVDIPAAFVALAVDAGDDISVMKKRN